MKGRGRRAIPAADTGKEEVSVPVCLMAPLTLVRWSSPYTTSSFRFPWIFQRRLLLAWEMGDLFFMKWIAQCVLSQPGPFLVQHQVHSMVLHLEVGGILIWKSCYRSKSPSSALPQPVQSVNELLAQLSQRSTDSNLMFLFQWNT